MQNFYQETVQSEYANSPTLIQMITNFNSYIDPSANLDAFYNIAFNVLTAQGVWLDNWGVIVGVGRVFQVPGALFNFGFHEGGSDYQPFGQAPFWDGPPATDSYILSDTAYRTLILVKALSNISNCSAPSYNHLLQMLFPGRGLCYVQDLGGMAMEYVFYFDLQPFELSIINDSGAFPHPAAVSVTIVIVPPDTILGFAEAHSFQPFGQGTFNT